ncbi:aminotransferase class I/II-fold pyridoxal phosphate-dependent enzyme, partial [Limosilactobacillus fermentum]|uniref:aminotransferase class I/II-fold pyridoxal phosphate-dependent enzyme n=1 Tax=Limosilactobacillus fermentum TaxID=1613 RepID=UPI00234A218A
PQQNTASARPTSFYYLMCQLDRVQYPPVYNIFFNSIINSGRQVNAYQMEYDQKTATYRVDWAEVEARMADPLTTMMILCNPHNPTGRVWTRGELEEIMTLANQYGVIVIADEIHGDLVMEGPDTRQPFHWGRS